MTIAANVAPITLDRSSAAMLLGVIWGGRQFMIRPSIKCLLLSSACCFASEASAQETVTYSYDALGRLTATSSSGTANNGLATTVSYDAAGNRSGYVVTGSGTPSPTPPPTPTPPPPTPTPPPPTNQPPVANSDFLTAPKCVFRTVNVVANDTDPDGHYPLTLTAVDQSWAWVENGTTVGMQTPDTNGVYTITYTIIDSLGATDTGYLTVTVSGAQQCV